MVDLVGVPVMLLNAHASMNIQEKTVKYLQVYAVYLVCHSTVEIPPFIKIEYRKILLIFNFYLPQIPLS